MKLYVYKQSKHYVLIPSNREKEMCDGVPVEE